MSDGELLAEMGTDAAKWAKEFSRSMDARLDSTPGERLHAWFCNAIEAGRTAGMAEEARTGAYRKGMEAALGSEWAMSSSVAEPDDGG